MDRILIMGYIVVSSVLFTGCISVAKLSHFENSYERIDFMAKKEKQYKASSFKRTFETKDDYYVELLADNDQSVVNLINPLLNSLGYKVIEVDTTNNVIFAERGLSLFEYKSIFGVYFKQENEKFLIYTKNEVTQDFTGCFDFNRSRDFLEIMCARTHCGFRGLTAEKVSPSPERFQMYDY